MEHRKSVIANCPACNGTGLGPTWDNGEANICIRCQGTGWETIEYTPFSGKGRRRRPGVKTVVFAHYTSKTGLPISDIVKISYSEFLKNPNPLF